MIKIKLKDVIFESSAPSPSRPERRVITDPKPATRPERRRISTPSPFTSPDIKPKGDYLKKIKDRYLQLISQTNEANYEKIFDKDTLGVLKSAVAQRKQGKSFQREMQKSFQLYGKINQAEEDYRDILGNLAVYIVEEAYPYVRVPDIIIDAEIVDQSSVKDALKDPGKDSQSTEEIIKDPEEFVEDILEDQKKRRLINALTQGGAAAARSVHFTEKDVLDSIGPDLAKDYKDLMDAGFNVYDFVDSSLMSGMTGQGGAGEMAGGAEQVYYDFLKQKWIIKARAVNFVLLIHEIVKGIYELIGLFGFVSDDVKRNEKIAAQDRIPYEIDDTKYGQLIYNNLRDIVNSLEDVTPLERDHIFQDIYKLPAKDFVKLITSVIKNKLTQDQKQMLTNIVKDVKSDLKADSADDELY